MRKKIKNLDEAIKQEEFREEAEKAFDNAEESAETNESKKTRKSFKEVKKELEEEDKKLLEEKEELPFKTDYNSKAKKARRTKLAVASFILLLGIGIMGNWYYENSDLSTSVRPLITTSDTKTLGEAEYVDGQTQPVENEYFAQARLDRESARDQSLEKLQNVIDAADESEEAKKTASEAIANITSSINIENKIETLVSAKGVNNCLAVISEDGQKVDVIVDVEELSDSLILQIKEIAMQQLGCSFENVSIIQSN